MVGTPAPGLFLPAGLTTLTTDALNRLPSVLAEATALVNLRLQECQPYFGVSADALQELPLASLKVVL